MSQLEENIRRQNLAVDRSFQGGNRAKIKAEIYKLCQVINSQRRQEISESIQQISEICKKISKSGKKEDALQFLVEVAEIYKGDERALEELRLIFKEIKRTT